MSESVRFRFAAPAEARDELIGEVHSLGCLGLHEEGDVLVAYFPSAAPEGALRTLAQRLPGVELSGPEPVPDEDWERSWQRGLEPRRVGPLWVRPSWCPSRGEPEIQIDPQQAFGSGEHASTRLALGLVLEALRPGERILDVGVGSGILALGALRLGAEWACGLDIDPAACANAAENGRRNGLRLALVRGTLEALRPGARFPIVVANLSMERLERWIPALTAHCTRALVLSGYLERERGTLRARLEAVGWRIENEVREAHSADTWVASRAVHTRSRHASSSSDSVSSKA